MTYLLLVLAFCIVPALGYFLGVSNKNRADYHRGYRDGRNAERSRTNARMIPANLEACRAGRLAERATHLRN